MKEYKVIPIGRAKDIRGERFGKLIVIDRVENIYNKTAWLCKCDCGNYKAIVGTGLTSGDNVSCGCKRAEINRPHDITGQKFGRWTAIRLTDKRSTSGDAIWECLCECGTVGEVKKSALSNGASKSCGCLAKELSSERQSKSGYDLTGKKFNRLKVIRPVGKKAGRGRIWYCECDCGGTIQTNASDIISGRAKSCGCLQIEHVTKLGLSNKGENNPAYNPNITDEEREEIKFQRSSDKAKKLRYKTYKRDNFKCKVCGNNRSLIAHHLDSFADNKNKRFDIDNLVTLCKDCHIEFHKEYGYGNNTREQFEEYINTVTEKAL